MPGFVSHTVMTYDVYNNIGNKNVSLKYMLTYSLGGDLCKYAKCRYDSHHKDQDKFITNMFKYIKDNNYINDKEIIGVLYGHICHYMMDDIIHPLVRKVDRECLKDKHNHTLIEMYYDTYLVKEKFNISKREYLKKKILSAKVNKKISKMLDYVYMETYHTKNVSKYYRFNLVLYRILRRLYLMFGIHVIEGLNGMDKFLSNNRNIDLINSDNKITYKNYQKNDSSDSLNKLYDECIKKTIDYIKRF